MLERFQSTHSLRSATYYDGAADATSMVSIHALLAECDPAGSLSEPGITGFNPRTPCGVRPLARTSPYHPSGFNPRTPCGVRLLVFPSVQPVKQVSIHALLAECDLSHMFYFPFCCFNPRTPCGVRPCCLPNALLSCSFQSTHSLRSATSPNALRKVLPISFNPRTPCGVRPRH